MTTGMTAHYTADRRQREAIIAQIGEGELYAQFCVDRGHADGPERHVITTTGIIIIFNAVTERLVTKLIARPGQVARYFPAGRAPAEIIAAAMQHQRLGLNNA